MAAGADEVVVLVAVVLLVEDDADEVPVVPVVPELNVEPMGPTLMLE